MLPKEAKDCAEKMTVEDRFEIYKEALNRIKEDYEMYMCVAIKETFKKRFKLSYLSLSDKELEELSTFFPEFIKYKPEKMYRSNLWFEDFDKPRRIELLKKVIKDTEKIINN